MYYSVGGGAYIIHSRKPCRLRFLAPDRPCKANSRFDEGQKATITSLSPGEFIGEESIAGAAGLRLATATAITAGVALRIERDEMIRVLHSKHAFSDLFVKFLLARGMRTQADLVDQLFNSSEKRLARILLRMAEFAQPGEPETLNPSITQEILAEMIGTTRSRVCFFMNCFRKRRWLISATSHFKGAVYSDIDQLESP